MSYTRALKRKKKKKNNKKVTKLKTLLMIREISVITNNKFSIN